MARRYRSGNSHSRGSSHYGSGRSDGYEHARQHIEDAQRLSRELGGTDVDVKAYFFSLPPQQLDDIFVEYGKRFGDQPEEYARQTIPNWKSGKVKMSGTVAERLFKLLPPRMPLGKKYELTESLWSHFGPSSKKRLRVGITADLDTAFLEIDRHIEAIVKAHHIPQEMEARFEWLAQGDINVKQHLLNHLRELERKHVSDGARMQLLVMIDHLKSNAGTLTHQMTQTLIIGKHELELLIDREFDGVALEEWKPPLSPAKKTNGDFNWIMWLIIVAGIVIWLKH